MTENKRFECNKGSHIIIDNKTTLHYIMTLDWECSLVTKLLNQLDDENEQLKQFKQKCIDWIDAQMKFNAKQYIETEDTHYTSENIDLHNLKVHLGVDFE